MKQLSALFLTVALVAFTGALPAQTTSADTVRRSEPITPGVWEASLQRVTTSNAALVTAALTQNSSTASLQTLEAARAQPTDGRIAPSVPAGTVVAVSSNLTTRHQEAAKALDQMANESAAILSDLINARIIGGVHLNTNAWASEDFRNTWDRLEGWGTSLSLLATAASASGLFSNNPDSRLKQISLSLSVGGITKLLGSAFGQQTGERFERQAQWVEATRRSYDLVTLYHMELQGRIKRVENFHNQVAQFQENGAFKNASTDEARRNAISQAAKYLHQYDNEILSTIPDSRSSLESLIETLCPGSLSAVAGGAAPQQCTYNVTTQRSRGESSTQHRRINLDPLQDWFEREGLHDLRRLRQLEPRVIAAAAITESLRTALLAPM